MIVLSFVFQHVDDHIIMADQTVIKKGGWNKFFFLLFDFILK